jgi:hypothetical protein
MCPMRQVHAMKAYEPGIRGLGMECLGALTHP